jgi:hypothetical protein
MFISIGSEPFTAGIYGIDTDKNVIYQASLFQIQPPLLTG